MKASLLKIYYKAAAWPPFYAVSIPAIIIIVSRFLYHPGSFSVNGFFKDLVMTSFYSGLIAVSAAAMFLCTLKKIARSLLFSLLAWFALPVGIIAWFFMVKTDISVINNMDNPGFAFVGMMAGASLFHVIGLTISFLDFRNSILLEMREEKTNPETRMTSVREMQTMNEILS